MKALRRLALIVVVILLAAGGYWVLRMRPAKPAAAATTSSQTVTVKQGNLTTNITVVGQLDSLQSQDMTFSRMSGTAKLVKLDAKSGQPVKAGQVLGTIDSAPYQQSLDQAKSDLQAAQEKLADLKTPATKLDIAKADLAIAKAQSSLEQARYNLSLVQVPDISSLQTAVSDAQSNLALANLQQSLAEHDSSAKSERDLLYAVDWHQRRINDLQALVDQGKANLEQTTLLATEQQTLGETQASLARVQATRQLSLKAAASAVAKAQATLADAQTALATARAGGDKLALAKAQVAVQDAQVSLAVAQDARTTLDAGADATTLAAAQADVDKKALAVSDAQANLSGTTLLAPFDGTVLQVQVAQGDLIAANTLILTMADMKQLQVVASVDETTIRRVVVGQSTTLTFDALAGQSFRGKVVSVPLQGALQNNVMVYEVPVSLTGAEQAPLLVGMTANVQIQVGQAANALLVPALAVQQVNGAYQVLVPADDPAGQPKVMVVEVGLSDGVNTQITKGLKAGDKVLVEYSTTTRNNNQNNRNGNILQQLLGRGGFGFPGR